MLSADYVIVGSGLSGSTIARTLHDAGREVLVLERRPMVGRNVADANSLIRDTWYRIMRMCGRAATQPHILNTPPSVREDGMSSRHSTRKHWQDLTGKKFGRLTILGQAPKGKHRDRAWICECSCGQIHTVPTSHLTRGNTQSCGCRQRELMSARFTTHGHARVGKHTPTYCVWRAILRRCSPSGAKKYPRYVGVYFYPAWRNYENFYRDMGDRPEGMSIDRINAELGYRPGNCRWATPTEQARNRRSNRLIEYQGRIQCIAAWAVETGISATLIQMRLHRGWSVEDALSTPPATKHWSKRKREGQSAKC